jgi:hypothetical protein
LQADLFNAGQRPALNVGISVSRVGGDAQTKAMRQVAGQLRLDLAQYRELAAFAQFASDLDSQTRSQLERGARLTELLKQDKYQPVALAEQVAVIYAGTQGYLDKVPVARVREWEAGFVRFLKSEQKELLAAIEKQKALDDKLFDELKAAISTFNHQFGVEEAKQAPDKGGKTADAAKPADKAQSKAQAPSTKVEAPTAAPAAQPETKAQAAAAPVEAPVATPATGEEAPAETDPDATQRPSPLNQIRAALADTPAGPKPKRPRKPKAP